MQVAVCVNSHRLFTSQFKPHVGSLLGGIDKEENLAALQKNIDAALAKDSAK